MRVEAGALARLAAEWYGPTVALTAQGESQTFDELFRSANRSASGLLSLGLERGDRVGVLARNTPEVVQAWLGMEAHNLVRVVLHSHFDMAIHVDTLNDLGATCLVFDAGFADVVGQHPADRPSFRRNRIQSTRLGNSLQRGRRVRERPAPLPRRRRGHTLLHPDDHGHHR
jgi:acyl-CoA synthetase (AMP-forming)/AMP-acid ligase II